MKLQTPRLWKIEKEMIKLKGDLLKEENEQFDSMIKIGVDVSDLESTIIMMTNETRHKIDILDLERKFIIDRQNNLFWRMIWNVLVPITTSLITVYFSS